MIDQDLPYEEYVEKVLSKLHIRSDEDAQAIAEMRHLYDAGFTLDEAVEYCSLYEEISPETDETIALARMNKISRQVNDRKWIK